MFSCYILWYIIIIFLVTQMMAILLSHEMIYTRFFRTIMYSPWYFVFLPDLWGNTLEFELEEGASISARPGDIPLNLLYILDRPQDAIAGQRKTNCILSVNLRSVLPTYFSWFPSLCADSNKFDSIHIHAIGSTSLLVFPLLEQLAELSSSEHNPQIHWEQRDRFTPLIQKGTCFVILST